MYKKIACIAGVAVLLMTLGACSLTQKHPTWELNESPTPRPIRTPSTPSKEPISPQASSDAAEEYIPVLTLIDETSLMTEERQSEVPLRRAQYADIVEFQGVPASVTLVDTKSKVTPPFHYLRVNYEGMMYLLFNYTDSPPSVVTTEGDGKTGADDVGNGSQTDYTEALKTTNEGTYAAITSETYRLSCGLQVGMSLSDVQKIAFENFYKNKSPFSVLLFEPEEFLAFGENTMTAYVATEEDEEGLRAIILFFDIHEVLQVILYAR